MKIVTENEINQISNVLTFISRTGRLIMMFQLRCNMLFESSNKSMVNLRNT